MKQVVQQVGTRRLEVVDVPRSRAALGGVVVRTVASLISAGTERTMIDFAQRSLVGKARERPELVRQVLERVRKEGLLRTLDAVRDRLEEPIPLGYSCAGIVEEVGPGADEFTVGDRVACAGARYATHAELVAVPKNLVVRIPDGVPFASAAYVTLGAIALQGVRVADVRLGERIAVIGLGLLGQLAVQILKASGCQVVGIDLDASKVARARELGADLAIARTDDVEAAVGRFTDGYGVDAVLVTAAAQSNDPIELAGALCRDRGRVSVVGAVRMDLPRESFYRKELELRLSRSYGPGRYDPEYEEKGQDYPIGYVRWTERRNMQEFLRLLATGAVDPARLTTHTFPLEDAEGAYAVVTTAGESCLGVVLTYGEAPGTAPAVALRPVAAAARGVAGIGFVGAGSFARGVLLPRFRRHPHVELVGVATATGLSARTTGTSFGFRYCTTDVEELYADPAVNAVVIATRHGSHARHAARALRAGRAVFLEKPLALNEQELDEVVSAQMESGQILAVGFNRRFSPLATALREELADRGPLAITYRVNAGPLPREHWIHDPAEGGGRIVGEVCHFIDLLQYLTGESPMEAFAHALGGRSGASRETVGITLRFGGGSIATVLYAATGDPSIPKERIEIFGAGSVAVIDDFRRATLTRRGKTREWRPNGQEKGFDEEIQAFLSSVRDGSPFTVPIASLVATTRTTFAIEESLRSRRAVEISTHVL